MRPSSVRAPRTVICWPTTARTASSNPSNAPGTRNPGCRCASSPSVAATTAGSQAEIEGVLHLRQHRRRHPRERRRHADGERVLSRRAADLDPPTCTAPRCAIASVRRYASAVTSSTPAIARAARNASIDVPVVGRAIGELEGEPRRQRAHGVVLAQARRRHPVACLPQRVEAAHAGEAAGQRDLGDRQRRVGQQALGEQQPLRLRVFDRRHAELGVENAPQVAAGHADARRECLDAAVVEDAVLDQVDRRLREPCRRVDAGVARRELGSAAQARPVAVDLGGRRAREKAAILAAAARAPCTPAGNRCRSTKRRRRTCRRSARSCACSAR